MLPTVDQSQDGGCVTMGTPRRNKWGIGAALLVLLAACSSPNSAAEDDPSTTAPEVTTTAESTAAPTPSTIDESDPGSSVDPSVAAATEVEAAFAEQFVAWRSCTADYDACDPDEAFADVYGGRAFDNLVEAVEDRQGSGRKNTPLDPDLDFQRVDGLTFADDELAAATIEYCSVDSRLVSAVNDAGEDEVFDDTVVHESGLAFYELGADGVWRLVQFDVILRSSEEPLCDG